MNAWMRGRVVLTAASLAVAGFAGGCDVDGDAESGGADGGADGGAGNAETSPFTGLETGAGPEPVLAVKIDNVAAARPQTGLDQADLVYVEPVEAGLTRLLAVYSSTLPEEIGPVRSGRESDLELMEQFGEPAFAYSGVQTRLLPVFAEAPLYPLTPDRVPGAYRRADDRPAPHNLYADPAALLDAAPDADEAADIGFRFAEERPRGGEPTDDYAVSFPAAEVGFTWSRQSERWEVTLDGADAGAEAATVVVQHVAVRDSSYYDSSGNVTPYTETTGSGTAVVLRDGRAYPAEWSRPSAGGGTEFTAPDGEPLPFDPGPVWVVFEAR